MSAVPVTLPIRAPRRQTNAPAPTPTHIEIVSSRRQKRARPRLGAAVITVGGLFVILAAQLLLTIATSDGAYEISSLQTQQTELARDEQVLTEKLRVLEAPQHLATEAHGLGMVASSNAAYLRLADATVLGAPTPAVASSAFATAADGTPLIADSLLAGVPLASAKLQQPAAEGSTLTLAADGTVTGAVPGANADAARGAPAADATGGSVASTPPAGIPTPITH